WDQDQMLKYDRELTCFYIISHPLARYAGAIQKFATSSSEGLAEVGDGREVKLCGIINGIRPMMTKKGDRMAYFQLEDMHGLVEVIAFPDLYKASGAIIVPESVIRVIVMVERWENGPPHSGTRIQ